MLYRFWVLVIWVPKLKIVYVCVVEKFEFFENYDEMLQQSRNSIMVFSSLPMDHWMFVYLDSARGLTSFCAPRLLAKSNAIKWIYCSLHVYCDYKMKPWGFHALF